MSTPDDPYNYEVLRVMMEEKRGSPVSIEEAIAVGNDLMDLFEAFQNTAIRLESEKQVQKSDCV